jgi:NADPH-dependent curcumin reductase CurA
VIELNRRIVLAERPDGIPEPRHFARRDAPIPALADGEFLVRNLYLSIDPAQRGWVNASANYSEPVPLGGVMRSLAVGVVAATRNDRFSVGTHCYGWFGWQDWCAATEALVLKRVDPADGRLTTALGVLGINGITAFLALTTIGRPRAGETVVVSTAAGAVGSLVGQLARRAGCRAVGITGSAAKVERCVQQFGYHAAIDYSRGLTAEIVRDACPQGVDVFFDNTSGSIADAVWPLLNVRARVVQCGTASIASWSPPPTAPRRERDVLVKRIRHEGFVIFDHVARFAEVTATLAAALHERALVYAEDIEHGLDRAPAALAAIYRGENAGKKIIEL